MGSLSKHFRLKHLRNFDRVNNNEIENSRQVEAKQSLAKCIAMQIKYKIDIQGIHKRMVRFIWFILLIPHHSFVYALYLSNIGQRHFYLDVVQNYIKCSSDVTVSVLTGVRSDVK
jgi:hypothetical protein